MTSMNMNDYSDIINDLGINASDDSIVNKNPTSTNDDDDKEQQSLVEVLIQRVETLTRENRLLNDKIEELQKVADVQQDDVVEGYVQLKVKYEEEQKDNLRLKEQIKSLQEENEQFKMKSLDHTKWKHWSSNEVYLYLMSLGDGLLKMYQNEIKTFVNDSQVKGSDLPTFKTSDWLDCGVSDYSIRKDLSKLIKLLTGDNGLSMTPKAMTPQSMTPKSYVDKRADEGENNPDEIDSQFKYFLPNITNTPTFMLNDSNLSQNNNNNANQNIFNFNNISKENIIKSADVNQNTNTSPPVHMDNVSTPIYQLLSESQKIKLPAILLETAVVNRNKSTSPPVHVDNAPDLDYVSDDDTSALEQEIIKNEKLYQISLNDTTKLEKEILENEEKWRKYVKSLPSRDGQNKQKGNFDANDNIKNGKNENNEQQQNHNQNSDDPNQHNNANQNSNNNNGDDEKKDENDDGSDDEEENKDEDEKAYDMEKLKKKMECVKKTAVYKRIKKTLKKDGLNKNELMAIVYYCDSDSACTQMKKAHRCEIKDMYWTTMYFHCTKAVEKIYQVLHYKNDEFKQNYNKLKKLYHGSTHSELSAYDKEQFFFKTITSFSTKDYVAKEFAGTMGMIFIIDNAFEGLYNRELRGASVSWLSDYAEYEFIILPSTFCNIKEYKNHGIPLNPTQNVYIALDFKSNKNPLTPHSDAVPKKKQISYSEKNAQKQNIEEQFELKHQSLTNGSRERNLIGQRNINRVVDTCSVVDCDIRHHDTIPTNQLDITHFSRDELVHIQQEHQTLYLRLTTWNKPEEKKQNGILGLKQSICVNNMNDIDDCSNPIEPLAAIDKQNEFDKAFTHFIQITEVDTDFFRIEITMNKIKNKSRRKYFIKESNAKHQSTRIKHVIVIEEGQTRGGANVDIEEKHDNSYLLKLYDKKTSQNVLPNCNSIHLITRNTEDISFEKPQCIDLSTLMKVKDKKNKKINFYWSIPPLSFGKISYKIINDEKKEPEIISKLPYTIPLSYNSVSFRVITIATIRKQAYESNPSKSITINGLK